MVYMPLTRGFTRLLRVYTIIPVYWSLRLIRVSPDTTLPTVLGVDRVQSQQELGKNQRKEQ